MDIEKEREPSILGENPPSHARAEFEDINFDRTDWKSSATNTTAPGNSRSADLVAQSVKLEFAYAMLGLVFGVVCILGGVVLFLRGVSGSASWTVEALGLESTLSDAGPGAVLFVVGLFVIFVTRAKVKMKGMSG